VICRHTQRVVALIDSRKRIGVGSLIILLVLNIPFGGFHQLVESVGCLCRKSRAVANDALGVTG